MSCKLYKGNLIDMMSISLIFIKNWNYDLIVDDLGVKDFMLGVMNIEKIKY